MVDTSAKGRLSTVRRASGTSTVYSGTICSLLGRSSVLFMNACVNKLDCAPTRKDFFSICSCPRLFGSCGVGMHTF